MPYFGEWMTFPFVMLAFASRCSAENDTEILANDDRIAELSAFQRVRIGHAFRLTVEECENIVDGVLIERAQSLDRGKAQMRCEDGVRHIAERIVTGKRLMIVDIECGEYTPFAERRDQRRLIDDWPARGVDKDCALLHARG